MKTNLLEAMDILGEAVFITDILGVCTFCNQRAKETIGLKPGVKFANEYENLWLETKRLLSRKGEPEMFSIDRVAIGPSIFRLRFGWILVEQEDGILFSAEDILIPEQIKQKIKTVKTQALQLNAIVQATTDGIWVCDADARVILLNPAAERINKIKKEEVLGKTMYELVKKGFVNKSAVIEAIEAKTPVSVMQYRDGRKLTSTGTPVFDENGSLTTVVVSTQDVTEIDLLREELERQETLNDNYRSQLFEIKKKSVNGVDFIAKSLNIKDVLNKAIKASSSDSTVLLFGESGTGKGLIAKLIHKESRRSGKPFISINCGAIPVSLIESELFGYEKGAFTGAHTKKHGLIEIADGGVLFLDEIAELPMQAQVKLLKFIEDGVVTRLGNTKSKKINIKVIAATHRDLTKRIDQKKFREDLFYRLNVIPITIPPLKERRDCLPTMIKHFIDTINAANNVHKKISKDALEYLLAYDYPGNIRQLINICERLIVLTDSDLIDIENLPKEIVATKSMGFDPKILSKKTTLKKIMAEVEKNILEKAFKTCSTQMKIANELGISQASVVRKLKKYDIQRKR